MHEILADLVAEQQLLDQYLQGVRDRDWKTKTPAAGWDVRDQVSHLAWSEEYALNALEEDGSRLTDAYDAESETLLTQPGIDQGRTMRPQEVIEWWRGARAKVVDALSRREPADRVPWFRTSMSARTFATARHMETWAHGLDVHASFGHEPEDSTRLRHIAWLGWRSLPFAFEVAGEDYAEPVRVELIGPDYSKWIYGPSETAQVIRGNAGEFCRVAVRRLAASRTSLKAEGAVAEVALRVVRTYI